MPAGGFINWEKTSGKKQVEVKKVNHGETLKVYVYCLRPNLSNYWNVEIVKYIKKKNVFSRGSSLEIFCVYCEILAFFVELAFFCLRVLLCCCVASFASVINSVRSSIIVLFSAVSCMLLSSVLFSLSMCVSNLFSLARMRSMVISSSLFCDSSIKFSSAKAPDFDRSSCKSWFR